MMRGATEAAGQSSPPATGELVQQQVTRLAEMRSMHAAFAWAQRNEAALRRRHAELVAIPAPPFGEAARTAWMEARFRELGLDDVRVDPVGNVFGLLRGQGPRSAIHNMVALSAHIDTVFPAGTKTEPRADGDRLMAPGVSDNGAGVIALLATASAFKESIPKLERDLLFIANVGEEGEGDLRGMRAVFQDPRLRDAIAYTLVIDGSGTDSIVTQALGSKRFEVTVRGAGGHSWSDFGAANPITYLARAIARVSEIELPAEPKTTLNFGVIRGGTSVNSIPESAAVLVDIRSTSEENIARLERALRDSVKQVVDAGERTRLASLRGTAGGMPSDDGAKVNVAAQVPATFEVKEIGNRPAAKLNQSSRMLEVLQAVDQHLGIRSNPRVGSTDANVPLAMGKEAVSIGGGGSGGGAHTLHEWFDPRGRDLAIKRILLTVATLAETK